MSQARQRALTDLVPTLLVGNTSTPVDLRHEFLGQATVIDFGCGMGAHTLDLAARGVGVLAIDAHSPGIARIAQEATQRAIAHNIRLFAGDGVALLRDNIAKESVDEIHVFYPDPWPKARQHKRRVIQAGFLDICERILVPHGVLRILTDVDGYAEHVARVLANARWITSTQPFDHVPTKYELRAVRLGHELHSFTATKSGA